ncbi:FAD-dependent oxidoreductase [Streptomyces sp. NPDC005408]|uniref:NAD(P)/FAD-dependent oxidoreductase n=1 Tax=Streptomyces sp. NPDC005408 TaxID=3155341 RepID=UPI0033AB19EF
MSRPTRAVDVLVVGGGPAGLAAGARLAAAGAGRVEILEREQQAGGIPRHCFHGGFGLRDLRRPMSGPQYARHLDDAVQVGADLRTGVTVTGWAGPRTLDTTGPHGLERITARAVVLATGARERPRSARLVPGTRPQGVLTTGELQQAVHLHGQRVGSRAVVVGAEAVAHSAVRTLRAGGAEVVAMVTDQPRPPSMSLRRRVPLLMEATVTELFGRGRLTGVALRHRDGRTTTVRCDTVVFTGDWIPDHELARRGGIPLDPGTRGPAVDTALRTADPGVFAAGNLLHGVEPASVAAEEGRHAAEQVLRYLAGEEAWPGPGLPVRVAGPLRWAAPNRIAPDGPRPMRGRFILRTTEPLALPVLVVSQDGRVLHRQRLLRTAVPGRALHLRADWTDTADAQGGPVLITAY